MKIKIKYGGTKCREKVVDEPETRNEENVQHVQMDERLEEIQPSQVFDQEKWQRRGILIGRIYVVDEMKNSGWDLCPRITRQGWIKILSQEEFIHTDLVREFYGCMNMSKNKTSFTTKLKGLWSLQRCWLMP